MNCTMMHRFTNIKFVYRSQLGNGVCWKTDIADRMVTCNSNFNAECFYK